MACDECSDKQREIDQKQQVIDEMSNIFLDLTIQLSCDSVVLSEDAKKYIDKFNNVPKY